MRPIFEGFRGQTFHSFYFLRSHLLDIKEKTSPDKQFFQEVWIIETQIMEACLYPIWGKQLATFICQTSFPSFLPLATARAISWLFFFPFFFKLDTPYTRNSQLDSKPYPKNYIKINSYNTFTYLSMHFENLGQFCHFTRINCAKRRDFENSTTWLS